jgi:hypothetical protein
MEFITDETGLKVWGLYGNSMYGDNPLYVQASFETFLVYFVSFSGVIANVGRTKLGQNHQYSPSKAP